MWFLTVRSPLREPREYLLKVGVNTLGRHVNNDILITDESASRYHAEIECKENDITLRDLGSTNGTFINGKRSSELNEIKAGDQIRIGFFVASINFKETVLDTAPLTYKDAQLKTRPLTQDFLLEAVDQNAVLLYDVVNRLTSALDLDSALEEISDFLRVAVGANKCHIILKDSFDQLEELGFSKKIAQKAIQKRSIVFIPDTQILTSISESVLRLRIRSTISVPVVIEESVVALVYVYKTDPAARPFDQNDVQLAVAVSHQVALAIQRTQILEEAKIFENWAFTDSLTGLNNRRHIQKLAQIEFERAKRFKHPLTMMMMDIDDFKFVNDSFGHLVGDQVLIAIAERLAKIVRSIDLLGRFGGDEFIILLVETDVDEANNVANRLNSHIALHPIETNRGQLAITLSIGVALLTEKITNLDEFISLADEALYAAKSAGKNQVEIIKTKGDIN